MALHIHFNGFLRGQDSRGAEASQELPAKAAFIRKTLACDQHVS